MSESEFPDPRIEWSDKWKKEHPAELPQTSTDACAESNLSEMSTSLLLATAPTTTITTDTDYAAAHDAREQIRTYVDAVDTIYKPQLADIKKLLAATRQRHNTHLTDALALDDELKSSMSTYQTAKVAKVAALNRSIAEATAAAQQKVLDDHATQLATEGKVDEAVAVLDTPLPAIKLPSAAPAGTTTLHEWKLIDASKLLPAYTQPNRVKISAAVRAHHHGAEAMVGEGSIRYVPKINPRRDARKKGNYDV